MRLEIFVTIAASVLVIAGGHAAQGASTVAAPVVHWSNEVRRAIVPAGPGGAFGTENYGNKFPGEAAIYMGIVHAAMYDAAVAVAGGYRPYAIAIAAPLQTSPAAAIATAARDTLVGLQPALGLTAAQQAAFEARYAEYLAAIPDDPAKANGIEVGRRAAAAVLARRTNEGPESADERTESAAGGAWCLGGGFSAGDRFARPWHSPAGARDCRAVPAGWSCRPDEPRLR